MTTIDGNYLNGLRCNLKHKLSGENIVTDAPKDNNGKGESFSPTDLVAAALGSCMLTIIGIRAKSKEIEIGQPTFKIIKKMASSPRRIAEISVEINFDISLAEENKQFLEREARNCPVALSLSESLIQNIKFRYA